ncbi:hypothetical protein [Chondromyces apiculatus]|uniref:Uncharacterized protein n=1 Tax=Chondromyces apiculatus DSM 436 TaxID=1192034 RepID=A0A017T4E8_9BACT|nr:hypothetical protein [Chondromyces apiculatus]EYF03685.1 Hypothetical protein CAP_5296 [Chondromyces apiculatus DSM 436]
MLPPLASTPRGLRVGAMIVGACAALVLSRDTFVDARGRSAALAGSLAGQGIVAAPSNVVWVDGPRGALGSFGPSSRALVRGAAAEGEASDLFLVDTALSPEGVLVGVGEVHNLTETSGADESLPVVRGQVVAYVSRPMIEGASPTVHVLDLRGHPASASAEWPRMERAQHAISNWQATGRLRGIGRRTLAVDAPAGEGEKAAEVSVALEQEAVVIRAGASEARVSLAAEPVALVGGAPLPGWLRAEDGEIARPGNLVTWAVDRVRTVIGDEAMQYVKMVGLGVIDTVKQQTENAEDSAEQIANEMGQANLGVATRQEPTDPELGWPPAPLDPWVTPPLEGEGQWRQQGGDEFLRKLPGLPPAFVTTFIRPDRSRKVVRVFVALWDPRQVELHMMSGTVEPKGATGEAGPGLIPRTPEVMKRVVAGSNAGFQALHGEFGMMADGVVYLPPKPFAATVAVRRDGTTAFGTWPENPQIPPWMMSYRQNMTVMVQDQKFNPYQRTWWGGTPPGWEDKTHTVRTGICLTKEDFVAYFYGADLSPEALSQAMIQVRCSYGIALDMNAGHSGLEFYHVAKSEELPALGRPLQHDWEAEGEVAGLEGWRFRGRRFIRGMGLMNFPRYIRREARDFFYMTFRHVLPGEALASAVPGKAGEGEWRVKGLPHHGFPYAVAVTEVRPDASRPDFTLRVLKMDPRAVKAAPTGNEGKVVALVGPGGPGASAEGLGLWHAEGVFSIGAAPPAAGASRIATGSATAAAGMNAVAAVGVQDDGGMLVYAEVLGAGAPAAGSATGDAGVAAPGGGGERAGSAGAVGDPRDAQALENFVKGLGCSSRLLLARRLDLALGGDTDLSGSAVHAPTGAGVVRLVRAGTPGAGRMFEDTPIVPRETWYPLQQKRIRYFKKADD